MNRTTNPDRADFFLVPVYGECFLWQYEMLKKKGREYSFGLTNQLYLDALNIIKQYPYWERSGGRDHVFVFPQRELQQPFGNLSDSPTSIATM